MEWVLLEAKAHTFPSQRKQTAGMDEFGNTWKGIGRIAYVLLKRASLVYESSWCPDATPLMEVTDQHPAPFFVHLLQLCFDWNGKSLTHLVPDKKTL